MSTKIYDAYRLHGRRNLSFADVLALSQRIRAELDRCGRALFYKQAADQLTRLIDSHAAGADLGDDVRPGETFIGAVAWTSAAAKDSVERGVRAPAWDFGAEWVFTMINGRLLLKLYAEQGTVEAFEKAFPEFRDYHYQNSTDRPKEITVREWRQRRKDWDAAFGSLTPAECCLAMKTWTPYSGPDVRRLDQVLLFMPTLEQRCQTLATSLEASVWLRRRLRRLDTTDWSKVSRVASAWSEAKTTQPVAARILRRAAALKRKLPREITRAMACAIPVPAAAKT